jgi:hypothetical protein
MVSATMKAITLLLFVFIAPACLGEPEEFHGVPTDELDADGRCNVKAGDWYQEWCGSPTDDFLCTRLNGSPIVGCDLPGDHVRHCVMSCE